MTETWQCPECLDHFGEEDDDVPPVCIMCRKASDVIGAIFRGAVAAVVEREAPYDVEAGLARLMDSLNRDDERDVPITGYTDAELEATRRPLPAPPLRRNPSSRRIPPR